MAKHEFSSENQPKNRKPRGKGKKTLVAEALLRNKKDETELYDYVIGRAFDKTDLYSHVYASMLLGRIDPIKRSTCPEVDFEFDVNSTPTEQAKQIQQAAATGEIPIDIALQFLSGIKTTNDVEEFTDLKKRIEELEKLAGVGK